LPIPKKKARAKDIGISVPFALELIKNEEAANPRNLRSDNPGYKQQMAYPAQSDIPTHAMATARNKRTKRF